MFLNVCCTFICCTFLNKRRRKIQEIEQNEQYLVKIATIKHILIKLTISYYKYASNIKLIKLFAERLI